MAKTITKEGVSGLLTKYAVAYKAGDTATMEKLRAEAHALVGVEATKEKK